LIVAALPVVGMTPCDLPTNLQYECNFFCRSEPALIFAEAVVDGLCCHNCSTGALTEKEGGEDVRYVCCHCCVEVCAMGLHEQVEVGGEGRGICSVSIK